MDVNLSIIERYSAGAKEKQADLCCPVDYDNNLLKALPHEIIERDYGCGDPSRYAQTGDTVLDLGSGGGKICYMAAQIVGPQGHVIGVDMNNDMLTLARKYQNPLQEKFGCRIDFFKGQIQDLRLDVEAMETQLANNPVNSAETLQSFEAWKQKQRGDAPLIEDNSISLVLSNCVLNLVSDKQKQQLINEIWRVTKPGGRIAISDIVSNQPIPQSMKEDPMLWSGCISGAFGEKEFLDAFADANFANVHYDKWDNTPWQIINGIEFRSVTIVANKPQPTGETVANVLYRGPHQGIVTDDGSFYERGKRYEVSARQKAQLLSSTDFIDLSQQDEPTNSGCSPTASCC